MSETFDPYHEWLGIPARLQPPTHYRLLGIAVFEESPTVIENAADRQMAHLRTFQTGKHVAESQKLLNEVATAKVCLLNPEKKAAYDAQLRQKLRDRPLPQPPLPPPVQPRGPAAADPSLAETAAFDPNSYAAMVRQVQVPGASERQQLGDFQLLERLGEGGMGAVYRALHTKLGREVAIKLLPKGRLQGAEAVTRFEREMRAIGALEHPNIVHTLDAGEIGENRCLVMELLDGLDLEKVLRGCGPLRVADTCEVGRQVALGLQCVHEHHLVHRGIKPSNLMLTRAGQVKILDLGLARAELGHAGRHERAATGQALGTFDYMAPEQIEEKAAVDVRADIYSLGCTLFKLLTGHAPFTGRQYETTSQKMDAHLRKAPPQIRALRQDVPAELAAMIYRMMAKSPDARFDAPAQVADAIGPMAGGSDLAALISLAQGTTAAPPSQADVSREQSLPSNLTCMIEQFTHKRRQGEPRPGTKTNPRVVRAVIFAAAVLVPLVLAAIWWALSGPGPAEVAQKPAGEAEGGAKAAPPKARQSYLILRCPARDLDFVRMRVDGKDIDVLGQGNSGEVRVALRAGPHQLEIDRVGYETIRRPVSIPAGTNFAFEPVWTRPMREKAPHTAKPTGLNPAATPGAKKVEPPAAPAPVPIVTEEERKQIEEMERAEARYMEALKPAEALVAAWDFNGALTVMAKVHFDDKQDVARLAARVGEVKRLAALKVRTIAKINDAQPPLKKSTLMLRGANGEVVKADEEGITTKLAGGETELHAWSALSEKARGKICQRSVDRDNADDWIASGLLALVHQDAALAEKCFDKAASLGATVDSYLDSLAWASFARAAELLKKKDFADADAAMADLEQKYGKSPWVASHKIVVDVARRQAKAAISEADAEKLYTEASTFFQEKEFFDLRPIVEKLKAKYATSRPVTDTGRKPSFAEMEQVVVGLGKLITVRQSGKGDFKTIQEAVLAAPPKCTIEIQDAGPYDEAVIIPREKEGLTLRGKKGCWPIITSSGPKGESPNLVQTLATPTTLERLVLAKGTPGGAACIGKGRLCTRRCIIYAKDGQALDAETETELERCVVAGRMSPHHRRILRDCLCLSSVTLVKGSRLDNVLLPTEGCTLYGDVPLKACVIGGTVRVEDRGCEIVDCIVSSVEVLTAEIRIVNCDVYGKGPYLGLARPGPGCFSSDPQFSGPKNLDYRLGPNSPCRGKASDGGDLGFRYTPEIIEMIKLAFRLRQKGVIKF